MNIIPTCIILMSTMFNGHLHIKKYFWYGTYEECSVLYKSSCIKFSNKPINYKLRT